MNLVSGRTIDRFAEEHAEARDPLARWVSFVRAARWTTPDEAVETCPVPTRAVGSDRLVFNIKGNHYRIVAAVRYATQETNGTLFIKFIGTHAEYDEIDAITVSYRPQ
jgi:mRNA interferase HigB